MTNPSIAIIGRGIIGLSTALAVAEAGWQVTVIAPAHWPSQASTAAQGLSVTKGLTAARSPLFAAKLAGAAHLAEWIQEVEQKSGRRIAKIIGQILEPFSDNTAKENILQRVYGQTEGISADQMVVTGDFLRYPGDMWVSMPDLLSALTEAAIRVGVRFSEEVVTTVTYIPADQHFMLHTNTEPLLADEVIVAAGAFSNALIGSRRPDLMQVCARGVIAKQPIDSEMERVLLFGKRSIVMANGIVRYCAAELPEETAGDDNFKDAALSLVSELRQAAGKSVALPAQDVKKMEVDQGLRGKLKHMHPAVGPIDWGGHRLFVNIGHHKNGLQFARDAARSLVDQLTQKEVSKPWDQFIPKYVAD